MTIDGDEDLKGLRVIGKVVARCLRHMRSEIRVGMTTRELDEIGAEFLAAHGAKSAPRVTYDFPASTCISVNEEVAHGIAGDRVIEAGDLVHLDVSAEMDGYYGDAGIACPVAPVDELTQRLCRATETALNKVLREIRHGREFRVMGQAIERVAEATGFSTIKNLGSHGIGRKLHEPPEFLPGFDDPREERVFEAGTVLAIEPFLTTGDSVTTVASDGWTMLNRPGTRTAQFEHTIVVTRGRPLVMTRP